MTDQLDTPALTLPDEEWQGIGAAATDDAALYLELDGWEGPLDLLLDLARRQKVDLRRLSILDLVDQYLTYIEQAEALRLELAADYLVMAAWLAYLKSALLLPREEQEDPSPEELALRLQLRLQRLAAMRDAAARVMGRDRLGRDVFLRGTPEGLRVDRKNLWQCDWFALVQAYGQVKARTAPVVHMVRDRMVMTLDWALRRVSATTVPPWRIRRAAAPGWSGMNCAKAAATPAPSSEPSQRSGNSARDPPAASTQRIRQSWLTGGGFREAASLSGSKADAGSRWEGRRTAGFQRRSRVPWTRTTVSGGGALPAAARLRAAGAEKPGRGSKRVSCDGLDIQVADR